uniref:DUF1618 domain-containing protein n=1 Tax=Setaria viridis TaxID=4556 RepID=A0A4U6SSC7_SETVI|nr:hypothetical protein SEVIR_9G105300v2 [Setaria viridis]
MHGQKLVEGLTLLLRFIDDDHPNLTASLCIRISDQALRIIQAGFGQGDKPLVQIGGGREMHARGLVHQADESLIALTLVFRLSEDERVYHLVHDAAGESLSMAADPPDDRASPVTGLPVPVRRRDDGVDLLKKRRFQGEGGKGFLFAHVAFSFQGQAFWANLFEGVLHGDLRAAGDSSHVDFDFITLSPGFEVEFDDSMELGTVNMFRTMGSAGDSVKYVTIDHSGDFGDRMVAVWTLQLDHGHNWRWNQDDQFSVRSIRELEDFKKARLPENVLRCPVVLPDGALWFLLSNKRKTLNDSLDDHICILDVHSMSILWSGRLRGFHTSQPAVLPSSFIKSLDPLVPPESKKSISLFGRK